MDGDVASALRKRYTTEPSVLALAGGLVSARWLFLVGCCLAAHCLAPGPAPTTAAATPDAASALFVLAVASALADLRLFPTFYRPPPRALLLLYDLLVSVAATSWAFSGAWAPLRAQVLSAAAALPHALPPALAPAPAAAARAARLALLALALAACAAVLHATELLPRLMDYYEDWAQARSMFAQERRRRAMMAQAQRRPAQLGLHAGAGAPGGGRAH